jgi:hypothetical protein
MLHDRLHALQKIVNASVYAMRTGALPPPALPCALRALSLPVGQRQGHRWLARVQAVRLEPASAASFCCVRMAKGLLRADGGSSVCRRPSC